MDQIRFLKGVLPEGVCREAKRGLSELWGNVPAGQDRQECLSHQSMICYVNPANRPTGCERAGFELDGVAGLRELLLRMQERYCFELPEEFAAQHRRAVRLNGLGHGLAFTTITVNRNWPTPPHRDSGTGEGTLTVVAVVGEVWEGGETQVAALPQLLSFDLRERDLLIFPGRELIHWNRPMIDLRGPSFDVERFAVVAYCG